MLRTIFALVAGLFATMIVITGMELLAAKWLFPLPPGLDPHNLDQVNAFAGSLSTSAYAWILGGWLLGSFVGAAVAALVSHRHRPLLALIIGALVVAGTIANAMSIHHPQWVIALGVVLPIPLALLAELAIRKVSRAPGR